jgi:hypothetical protein
MIRMLFSVSQETSFSKAFNTLAQLRDLKLSYTESMKSTGIKTRVATILCK